MADKDLPRFSDFVGDFDRESDRAVALLVAAYLDSAIEDLLRSRLITNAPDDIFKYRGPLGDFHGRVEIAYALGLISAVARNDLHLIRTTRNDFAHSHDRGLSFDSDALLKRTSAMGSLKRVQQMVSAWTGDDSPIEALKTSRGRFLIAFAMLLSAIQNGETRGSRPIEVSLDDEWRMHSR